MILVELLNSRLEVRAFLSLDEQLRDLGATLHVFWTDLSHFALLGMGATASARAALGLDVRRTEGVIGELALVLGLGDLGFAVPELAFLVWHVLPGETYDLRKRAVVRLDLRGDVATLDERRAEEDKGVGGTRDMIVRLLLPVSWLFGACAVQGGWEERRGGPCTPDGRKLVRVCARRDGRGESDLLVLRSS